MTGNWGAALLVARSQWLILGCFPSPTVATRRTSKALFIARRRDSTRLRTIRQSRSPGSHDPWDHRLGNHGAPAGLRPWPPDAVPQFPRCLAGLKGEI